MTMRVDLVVAKYKEDVSWLRMVPPEVRIFVYDKRPDPDDWAWTASASVTHPRQHPIEIMPMDNVGREADTYLTHVLRRFAEGDVEGEGDVKEVDVEEAEEGGGGKGTPGFFGEDRVTVFTQGDPFPHSPDFLDLLDAEVRASWAPLQPLSVRYLEREGLPPPHLVDADADGEARLFLRGRRLRVGTQPLSNHTLNTVRFHDHGAERQMAMTLEQFGVPHGTNLVRHLLESAGLPEGALGRVRDVGRICWGAIFAARDDVLGSVPERVYRNLRQINAWLKPPAALMERAWMTLFLGASGGGDRVPSLPWGGSGRGQKFGAGARTTGQEVSIECDGAAPNEPPMSSSSSD